MAECAVVGGVRADNSNNVCGVGGTFGGAYDTSRGVYLDRCADMLGVRSQG